MSPPLLPLLPVEVVRNDKDGGFVLIQVFKLQLLMDCAKFVLWPLEAEYVFNQGEFNNN